MTRSHRPTIGCSGFVHTDRNAIEPTVKISVAEIAAMGRTIQG
jgi:hypothetical protein